MPGHWPVPRKIIEQKGFSKFAFILSLFALIWGPNPVLPQTKYSSRVVQTEYGKLRGIVIVKRGSLPRDVEGFLGVPYASGPSASLRFMPPLTPSRWDGIKTCDRFGPACPQILPRGMSSVQLSNESSLPNYRRVLSLSSLLSNQSEDCLYLNIYVPYEGGGSAGAGDSKKGAKMPILVILQGDSYEWGAGNLIDGSVLASYGKIMVITLNYRIGILGFLKTSNQQGNYAIMDIVAALFWIRENGQAFGAFDVNRITLLGHKTGASLANFLIIAPVAKQLFHRVIMLSGSSLSLSSFQRSARANARKLAEILGCNSPSNNQNSQNSGQSSGRGPNPFMMAFFPQNQQNQNQNIQLGELKSSVKSRKKPSKSAKKTVVLDERDISVCLREIPLKKLLDTMNEDILLPRFASRSGPLIDGSAIRSDYLSEMTRDPQNVFSSIPLLMGVASFENLAEISEQDRAFGLSEVKKDRIFRTLIQNSYLFHLNEIFSTVKNEYNDWNLPGGGDKFNIRNSVLSVLSDSLTVAPLVQVANLHAQKANKKTFFLHFKYEPDAPFYSQRIGSSSEDLLNYAVGHPLLLGETSSKNGHPTENDEDYHIPNEVTSFDNSYTAVHKLYISSLPKYSDRDVSNCKIFLRYLLNFITSGDPNNSDDGDQKNVGEKLVAGKSRVYNSAGPGPFAHPLWDSYDPINQLYMEFGGVNLEMKNHYRGHKLALWLNLIPQLHYPGGPEVPMQHHHFKKPGENSPTAGESHDLNGQANGSAPDLFDGKVRESPKTKPSKSDPDFEDAGGSSLLLSVLSQNSRSESPDSSNPSGSFEDSSGVIHSDSDSETDELDNSDNSDDQDQEHDGENDDDNDNNTNNNESKITQTTTECPQNVTTPSSPGAGNSSDPTKGSAEDRELQRPLSSRNRGYGTALGITIGIGICLLLLNLFIFIAIYHQRATIYALRRSSTTGGTSVDPASSITQLSHNLNLNPTNNTTTTGTTTTNTGTTTGNSTAHLSLQRIHRSGSYKEQKQFNSLTRPNYTSTSIGKTPIKSNTSTLDRKTQTEKNSDYSTPAEDLDLDDGGFVDDTVETRYFHEDQLGSFIGINTNISTQNTLTSPEICENPLNLHQQFLRNHHFYFKDSIDSSDFSSPGLIPEPPPPPRSRPPSLISTATSSLTRNRDAATGTTMTKINLNVNTGPGPSQNRSNAMDEVSV